MNISVRCKVRSEYSEFKDTAEYTFNSSLQLFKSLILYLKHSQLCNVFEMENVDLMIERGEITIVAPSSNEKYITLYTFPSIFEFYMYTDRIGNEVLNLSQEDSLRAILSILNSTGDLFNDPTAEEWLENVQHLGIISVTSKYPIVVLEYYLRTEFGDLIPKIIAESKHMEDENVE